MNKASPFAGFLYPPGDYEQAIQSTHKLVSDAAFRQTMAAAARADVEQFGWSAAISRVRNLQYQRAIRIYKAHKRYAAACAGMLEVDSTWLCSTTAQV